MSKNLLDFEWDGSKVRIRPSAVDTFYNCSFQWFQVFMMGHRSMPSARAAIGTAVHAGVEAMWKEAQLKGNKEINQSMMNDAAIESYQEQDTEFDLMYDNGEDLNTAQDTVLDGTRVFVEDIVPFTDIPEGVEEFIEILMEHPVVSGLGGTIDYIGGDIIADVKTSKRKPIPASYTTQQDIYKMLAESQGRTINHSIIQGIAFTKNPVGHILELENKIDRTKFLVNSLLDTLEAFHKGADPTVLFRGNPKYYLCSPKYCNFYNNGCPYISGEMK